MLQTPKDSSNIQSTPKRFLVVGIIFVTGTFRGFCQATFGTVNDVISIYFKVQPWQVDWLSNIYAVVLAVAGIPLLLIIKRVGLKSALCLTVLSVAIGSSCSCIAFLYKGGFAVLLVGQTLCGVCVVTLISLRVEAAAVWFPAYEVAPALAFMLIGRELGEVSGAVVVPNLVSPEQKPSEVKLKMGIFYGTLSIVMWSVVAISWIFLEDRPAFPPSVAEAQARESDERKSRQNLKSKLENFKSTQMKLMGNPSFILLLVVKLALAPLQRINVTLLSSVLKKNFPRGSGLDIHGGYMVVCTMLAAIAGNCLAGLLLSKTRWYRGLFVASSSAQTLVFILGMLGLKLQSIFLVYIYELLFGFTVGVNAVCAVELVVEVTYPIHSSDLFVISASGMGLTWIIGSVVARAVLDTFGSVACLAYPLGISALSTALLSLRKMDFLRQQTEDKSLTPLLQKDDETN